MDRVGVRQAGGLGGDLPVVRLVGLNAGETDSLVLTHFEEECF